MFFLEARGVAKMLQEELLCSREGVEGEVEFRERFDPEAILWRAGVLKRLEGVGV